MIKSLNFPIIFTLHFIYFIFSDHFPSLEANLILDTIQDASQSTFNFFQAQEESMLQIDNDKVVGKIGEKSNNDFDEQSTDNTNQNENDTNTYVTPSLQHEISIAKSVQQEIRTARLINDDDHRSAWKADVEKALKMQRMKNNKEEQQLRGGFVDTALGVLKSLSVVDDDFSKLSREELGFDLGGSGGRMNEEL